VQEKLREIGWIFWRAQSPTHGRPSCGKPIAFLPTFPEWDAARGKRHRSFHPRHAYHRIEPETVTAANQKMLANNHSRRWRFVKSPDWMVDDLA
jgi:hypothetical protein